MFKRLATLALFGCSLTACDAAQDIAGDALQSEMKNAIVAQCQGISESAGLAADRINEVCECSAQAYIDDPDLTMEDVSRERVEAIVNECAANSEPGLDTGNDTTPTE